MTEELKQQSEFLKNQLEKPTEDSKKWKAMVIGLKGVGAIFLVGAGMFLWMPAIAAQIATLVQFALAAWGGIVSIFLGAQGTVDFKTTAALQAVNETKKEDKTEDIHQTIEVIKAPKAAHFDGDDIP